MPKPPESTPRAGKLRHSAAPTPLSLYHRAELLQHKRQHDRQSESGAGKAGGPERLLYELEVHQIELEMQNTELQKTRELLELALAKYTDLYDLAPVGYLSIDESGVILEANLTSAALLGVKRHELINRRLPLRVAPSMRPIFQAFLKRIFTGPHDQICEILLQKEGGGTFWTNLRAAPAVPLKGARKWCRIAFGDITAAKKAEDALRASEERFRALFELGPVAIYSCDISGQVKEFNRRAVELWGRKPGLAETDDRFCGSFKLFRPNGSLLPHAKCPMAAVLSGKESVVRDTEVVIERPDGSRITALVNIRPLKDDSGRITGAINCFYDITDRKHAEETQRRMQVLAASNKKLEQEITRRHAAEKALTKSERHALGLLEQSQHMQEQLRMLSRKVLTAQEQERKRISRDLHDVIAQTLTSINLRLATLKGDIMIAPEDLEQNIVRTQRLVEDSVNIVHQFARELRPTVLDDLGLVPALHSFMKGFKEQTGIHLSLTAFPTVEQVSEDKRTVLYRVVQEALNNIAQHAKASRVDVTIHKVKASNEICMKIKDDGQGFKPDEQARGKKRHRLGLLGMRERLEMINGTFAVESAPGKGTTILAQIPFGGSNRKGRIR
jgi:PAS domain S-box-containing protein